MGAASPKACQTCVKASSLLLCCSRQRQELCFHSPLSRLKEGHWWIQTKKRQQADEFSETKGCLNCRSHEAEPSSKILALTRLEHSKAVTMAAHSFAALVSGV